MVILFNLLIFEKNKTNNIIIKFDYNNKKLAKKSRKLKSSKLSKFQNLIKLKKIVISK